jgi:hypothetical protein
MLDGVKLFWDGLNEARKRTEAAAVAKAVLAS